MPDAWEVIAAVRDRYPRTSSDAPTEEIVAELTAAGLLVDTARAEGESQDPSTVLVADVPRESLIAATVLAQVGPVTAWRAAEWARKIAEPMIAAELRRLAGGLVDTGDAAVLLEQADEIDGGTPR